MYTHESCEEITEIAEIAGAIMSIISEFDLSSDVLSTIVAGMRQLAHIDGDFDPQEEALLNAVVEGLDAQESLNLDVLTTPELKENFMKMLAMMAVADAKVVDEEVALMDQYGVQLGLERTALSFVEEVAENMLTLQYTSAELTVLAPKLAKTLRLSNDCIERLVNLP